MASASRPRQLADINPKLARFKRQNPGSGPHGFGGTYKKGEKGGFRPAHADEHIPLAERGLARRKDGFRYDDEQMRGVGRGRGRGRGGKAATVTPALPAAPPKKAGTSALKSKIRDLTRLLNKKDLDPTVRQHKSHELSVAQKQLAARIEENRAAKIDAKYKTIKFYERRKILRKLSAQQRKLAKLYTTSAGEQQSAEEKAIRKEMQKWQDDLDYIDYYPHGQKYVSLFRNPADSKNKNKKSDNDDGSDSDSEEEPEQPSSSSEEEGEDGEVRQKPKLSIEELQRAVEEKRAEVRKYVAKTKKAALKAKQPATATSTAVKRKREEKMKDALFEEDDDGDEEDEQQQNGKGDEQHMDDDEPSDGNHQSDAKADDSSDELEAEAAAPPRKKSKREKNGR